MRPAAHRLACRVLAAVATLALGVLPACGTDAPPDWRNRSIPWTYGPTTGGATDTHLRGTGTSGPGPLAQGWQWRLTDGRQLSVAPYELAKAHALFGKAALTVGLFDATGKQIGSVRSGVITAGKAAFPFAIEEDVARRLNDVVIWYVPE